MPEQDKPKTTGLTFSEAMAAAKNGKGICRRAWLKGINGDHALREGIRTDKGQYGSFLFLTEAVDPHQSYEAANMLFAIGQHVMPDNGRRFSGPQGADMRRLKLSPMLWFVGEATPDGAPLSAWGARPDDLLAQDWLSFSFYE